jgi:hypothetical protein
MSSFLHVHPVHHPHPNLHVEVMNKDTQGMPQRAPATTAPMTPSSFLSPSGMWSLSGNRSNSNISLNVHVNPDSPRAPLSERDLSPLSPLSPDSQTETSQITTKILVSHNGTYSQPRGPISQPTQPHLRRPVQQSVSSQKQRQRKGSLRVLLVDNVLNKKLPLHGVKPQIVAPHRRLNPTHIPDAELDHFIAVLDASKKVSQYIRILEAQNPKNNTERVIKFQKEVEILKRELERICRKYQEDLDVLRVQHDWGQLKDNSWDLTDYHIINLPHADYPDIFLYNDLVGLLNKQEELILAARRDGTPIDPRAVEKIKKAGLEAIEKAEQKADPEYSTLGLVVTALLFVACFVTLLGVLVFSWPIWLPIALAGAFIIGAGLLIYDSREVNQEKEICKDKYQQIREAFMREGRFNKDEVESVGVIETYQKDVSDNMDDYFALLVPPSEGLNDLLSMPIEGNLENSDRLFIY